MQTNDRTAIIRSDTSLGGFVTPQYFEGTRRAYDSWSLLAILLAGAILPTFVYFVFKTSSLAAGLLAGSVLIIFMVVLGLGRTPSTGRLLGAAGVAVILIVPIAVHSAIAAFVDPPDIARTSFSALVLSAVVFAALIMADTVFDQDEKVLRRVTNLIRALFILLGIAAVLGFRPGMGSYDKPVFPFTEPSYYALAFTPFLIDGCVRSRGWKRLALLGISFALAYLLQSLSLIVGTTVAALICLPIVPLTVAVGFGFLLTQWIDIAYFVDRLDLTYESDNLSTLVYIQGWELVQDSLHRSSGWGIGFQQLGFTPINSPTADRIRLLFGGDYNIQDGGFTASKLLSEFGFFALILLALYLLVFFRAALALRANISHVHRELQPGQILAYSFICGFFVELFVRGGGYFSGTAFFAVASLAYLSGRRRKGVVAARGAEPETVFAAASDEGAQLIDARPRSP